jgi:Bacterial regulatory proteins, tetR family
MRDDDTRIRPYQSDLRRRQAAETRLRVVEAAGTLFGRQGYRYTTFAQLAEEAGVSVKTVQEHGPKSALLQAAIEVGSFGVEGETDFLKTDLGQAMLQVRDPGELATMVGEAMLTINAPSAGLWMTVVGAAHGDEELSGFHADMLAQIRGQVGHVLRYVGSRGWLRTDVPFDDLVEAFCIVTSVETFVRFVQHDGKSRDAYKAFVARTVRETILAP